MAFIVWETVYANFDDFFLDNFVLRMLNFGG